jgi:hypothetical protein
MVSLYYSLDQGVQDRIGANRTYALDVNGTVAQVDYSMFRDLDKIDTACPSWSNGQWIIPAGFNANSTTCPPPGGLILEDATGEELTIGCVGANLTERTADCTTKVRAYVTPGNVTLVRRGDDKIGAIVGGIVGGGLPAAAGAIFAGYKVHASRNKVDMMNGGGMGGDRPGGMGNGMGGIGSDAGSNIFVPSEVMSQVARDNVNIWRAKVAEMGKH